MMPTLITRNGGQMSSANFMRLVRCVIPNSIIDGCAITKNNSTIYIAAGHIVAGGALVEVEAMSLPVSSGGELVLRINLDDEAPVKIITRTAQTLTQQDIVDGGKIYELQLATYTYASGSIASLSVGVKSVSETGTGTTVFSGGASTVASPSSGSTSTVATGTKSGTLTTTPLKSTASTPTVYYSLKYTATRSGSKVTVNLTVTSWLPSDASYINSGTITAKARINGGAWASSAIKGSESWKGKKERVRTLTLTANTTDKTAKVEFYVSRSGGDAGRLSTKSYSIKLP